MAYCYGEPGGRHENQCGMTLMAGVSRALCRQCYDKIHDILFPASKSNVD
jgi:hypothetical protein